ncbi:MAG: hypothetical protein C0592_02305 [Marinilabiliales bacterium]|nr:MAG: hypothetical protein C0592_02305 [Marinilabiliales bacterium]
MRSFSKFLPIILIAGFLFQSCIELEEKITINSDKSGEYSLKLDMGALSSMGGEVDVPEELTTFPQIISEGIKDVSGISDIKTNVDEKAGLYQVSFHFQNHSAFKRALLKLAGMKYGFIVPNYLKVGKHRFKRTNIQPMIAKAIEKSESDFFTQSFMGTEATSFINVTTVIETPKPVKKVKKNGRARKVTDNRVEIKGTLTEIIKGMDLGVVVKF